MLAKRIIPCLDVDAERVVKGVKFAGLQDAGDPIVLASNYSANGADELAFLDITASFQKRKTLISLVEKIAKNIFIPFTVGGGIQTVSGAKEVLRAGADKISINSAAVKNPGIISDLANIFGSQCIVVAIDVKKTKIGWEVFINGGRVSTNMSVLTWVRDVVKMGAGELLLTCIDSDGTQKGFNIELTNTVSKIVPIPVIASGGAGSMKDFSDVFIKGQADGALAASLFHFKEVSINNLKEYLIQKNISIRK